MASRKPNPHFGRERDHRRRLPFASAFMSADTVELSTEPEIRIRPPVANSISMMPALEDTTAGSGVTATGLNSVCSWVNFEHRGIHRKG